jgi:hypothetical protein
VKEANREMLLVAEDPGELLDRFGRYRPPTVDKWIRKGDA